jgi:uncharacterized protein YqfB (UPF0267 family)
MKERVYKMITIRDNRNSKYYKPQVRDLITGEFFEYEDFLYMKIYEGSPTHFKCFNFYTKAAENFDGSEEVEIIKNITLTIENN